MRSASFLLCASLMRAFLPAPPPTPPPQTFFPHVVEPALGLGRLLLAMFCDGVVREALPGGGSRVVFRVAEALAPIKVAVLPLQKGMAGAADALADALLPHLRVEVDSSGSIGKRYRRADEAGTPLCATVDHRSLEDGTVTLRDRDTMRQLRLRTEEVVALAGRGALRPSALPFADGEPPVRADP
jgi:glycyl-tRNA synthetase